MTDNPFAKKQNLPSISFAVTDAAGNSTSVPIGTRIGGKVTRGPEVVQKTGYPGTPFGGKPLFWDADATGRETDQAKGPDGRENKKVEQVVIQLMVGLEEMSLWVSMYPKYMFEAIQEALGDRAIEVGDELYITLTGFGKADPGKNPPKLYSAEFIKGQGVFAPAPPPPPAASAPPPPPPPAAAAPPPPPPPPPAAVATTPEGYTLDGLIAGGWTREQAIASYPVLAPVATNGDAKAAALAALSEADRNLLLEV